MVMQPAENGRFTDNARRPRRRLLWGNPPVYTHMRTLVVVIPYELSEDIAQLSFGENDKMVKAFPADGADKTLRIRVHVRGVGNAYRGRAGGVSCW
jgi:hypothetical protein